MSRCQNRYSAEEERERKQAKTNAARECKAERDTLGAKAFGEKYGENPNKRNAYGKCVSAKVKEIKAGLDREDEARAAAFRNAAKACAAERSAIGREAFAKKYGTNPGRRNAFGKCVSRAQQRP